MKFRKIFSDRYNICFIIYITFAYLFTGMSVANELVADTPLNKYGAAADQLLKLQAIAEVGMVEPFVQKGLFLVSEEKPVAKFHLIAPPKPEITGNLTIDKLNSRELKECLLVWGTNNAVCYQAGAEH